MATLSLNDFLGHKTSVPFGKRFGNWKENGPATIWLHRRLPFQIIWTHGFSQVVKKQDDSIDVWGASFVCHDSEEVVQKQFKRDDDGARIVPPQKCGICKMLDWISVQVAVQEISWVAPIFRFEGDDPKNNRIYRAGGLLGMFNSDKLNDSQRAQMRKAGVYAKEAWKEQATAKAKYEFCLVDNADLSAGCVVATEPAQLGDKLKKAIRDVMTQSNVDQGDPTKNPYAFRFEYDASALMQNKYHVVAMPNIPLTPAIDSLISADPPDTGNVTNPFDPVSVRRIMEEACLIDMPWGEFFGESDSEEKPAVKPTEENDDDLVECDKCHRGMSEDATTCSHCGEYYGPNPHTAEVTPPMRTRSARKSSESTFDTSTDDETEIPFK